jgi:hypothetical protein
VWEAGEENRNASLDKTSGSLPELLESASLPEQPELSFMIARPIPVLQLLTSYSQILTAELSNSLEIGSTPPVDVFPILKYLPQRLFNNWRTFAIQVRDDLHGFHKEVVDEVRARRQQGKKRDALIDRILERQESLGLTEHQVDLLAGVIIDGGSDTTTSLLRNFMVAVTCFHGALKAAQAEIDSVMDSSRSPVWADRARLPYVNALVKEVLRWRPAGGLIPPHMAAEGGNLLIQHRLLVSKILTDEWQMITSTAISSLKVP